MLLMYTEDRVAKPDKDTIFIPWDHASNGVDFIDITKQHGTTQLTFIHYVNFDETTVYKAMKIDSVIMSEQVLKSFLLDIQK
jgi:hypothetical protein